MCSVHGVESPSLSRLYLPCCISVSICCVQCTWCREPVFEQAVSTTLYFCISVLCAVYMVSRARLRAGCIHHVVFLYLCVVCSVHGVESPSSSRLYPPCCLSVSLCCVQCTWCREPVFEQAVSAMLYFCIYLLCAMYMVSRARL